MENIVALKEFLSTPRKVAIVSHRNPDGDAIGSSLALFHYLSRHGHDATIAFPSEYPPIFKWMPGSEYILIHDKQEKKANKLIAGVEIVFCLDFNALHRIDKLGEKIAERTDIPKVLIDHHLYPEDFAEYAISNTDASSTCELIYDFIELMDDLDKIDDVVGECMLTGIITDTGSFRYCTSAKLYRIVAELKDRGVDDIDLQNKIFNSQTAKQLRLLGYCLSPNVLTIFHEYNTGVIVLTKEDYKNWRIQRGDTEGIVNNILRIKKIKLAALITEREGFVKLSLRSKGEFSVQEIASKYFKGGGHRNASGGMSKLSLEDTKKQFAEILPKYAEELTQPIHY